MIFTNAGMIGDNAMIAYYDGGKIVNDCRMDECI